MKLWAIIFFLLPILGCIYAGWSVWRILPLATIWKIFVITAMIASLMLLFVGFGIGLDKMPLPIARIIYTIGTSSIFVLLYLVMLFLVLHIGELVHLIPTSFMKSSTAGSLTVLAIMLGIFTYANINYNNKVRVPINLQTNTTLQKPLTIVMLSDLHLGYHNPRKELAQWVDIVNAEHPDLILIAGDIIDKSVRPLIEENMAQEFKRLNAPIYACLGNHEYFSGEPRAQQFYKEAGIHLLRDSSVTLPQFGNLTIIGRDDRTNRHRKSIKQLMQEVHQPVTYTILLDHQPYDLELSEQAGIDFQLSGHTHYGQVWPISWIEDAMYENAYGPSQRGKTQFYVTSGIGIWGGKFRIGTQSEYVVAHLEPSSK
ncbi:MAG: metallophosphoesterase [Prevotella sp.]|nr:metallophosphoesterase [Prevotella sp.]